MEPSDSIPSGFPLYRIVREEEPGPKRLLSLIEGLQPPPGAITLTIAPAEGPRALLRLTDSPALSATLAELLSRQRRAGCGLVIFWSTDVAYAVRPPLPPDRSQRIEGWDTAPIVDGLGRPRLVAVLLLRRGGYAVGVFAGDVLLASKSGSRFVKNRHRKGGQSQRRFDRIREKQLHELFGQVCEVARDRIEPFANKLDALFLGGDGHTLQDFLKECPYIRSLSPITQSRFLTTPEPRHETLQLAHDLIWRSQWIELRPPTD